MNFIEIDMLLFNKLSYKNVYWISVLFIYVLKELLCTYIQE